MPRKSNKKPAGVKSFCDPSAQQKIEQDFEKAQQKIKAQIDNIKRFEELVSMKITVEHCPGCRKFLDCSCMRYLQMFNKRLCYPDPKDPFSNFGKKIFAAFAKGITMVEDLKPNDETFSGN